ncbi:hypothetical protein WJU16_22825 [Chitinophaga pollutisoli]|uniref:Lipoprotein n=1 Tax=Chitinophaga pollutisoli TaxID=3133966 RepID=A0ABZ2YMZ2_9BACT
MLQIPFICSLFGIGLIACACTARQETVRHLGLERVDTVRPALIPIRDSLAPDTAAWHGALRHLAHGAPSTWWPAGEDAPPLPGALLPFHRILAYYGNLYSPAMGILGTLPEQPLFDTLSAEARRWKAADPSMPVIPALHYIAITAQRSPGKDGKYRLRMPHAEIDKIIAMARRQGAIVFLDIQPGHSDVATEARTLAVYLAQPDVHLGLDPEYNMTYGQVPCSAIGTMDATAINAVSEFLADLVREYQLPPKILVVHRFTQAMVTNADAIRRRPEVQFVMNMDGFGSPAKKKDTYKSYIGRKPVQFTGFKLFYKVDPATGGRLMQPHEVLLLQPSPVYIQYQ